MSRSRPWPSIFIAELSPYTLLIVRRWSSAALRHRQRTNETTAWRTLEGRFRGQDPRVDGSTTAGPTDRQASRAWRRGVACMAPPSANERNDRLTNAWRTTAGARRKNLVNFRGGKKFLLKNMSEKLTNCPNFTLFLPEKLSKYPNFYNICPKKLTGKFPNFTWFLP